jgi:membrane protease YdiL (CAAX protease family)
MKLLLINGDKNMTISWMITGYLLLFIPILEFLAYRKYKQQIADKTFRKQSFYNSTFIELWTPVIGVMVLLFIGEIKLHDIGLNVIAVNAFSINSFLFIGAAILAVLPVLLILLSIYQYIGIKSNVAFRDAYMAAVKKQVSSNDNHSKILNAILPRNMKEKIQWIFLSITAGITEEILFRGFLIYCAHYAFPNFPIPYLLLLQAVPFSLMHLYQGTRGVLTTFFMGIVFGLYVVVFGSIIPGIIIHILVDLSASLIEREQAEFENVANA